LHPTILYQEDEWAMFGNLQSEKREVHPYNLPRRPRGLEVQLYSLFKFGSRWGGWLTPGARRFTRRKKTRYAFYRKLGGPQGRSGQAREISPPLGFDPRTV
jgi:hypothetical protein